MVSGYDLLRWTGGVVGFCAVVDYATDAVLWLFSCFSSKSDFHMKPIIQFIQWSFFNLYNKNACKYNISTSAYVCKYNVPLLIYTLMFTCTSTYTYTYNVDLLMYKCMFSCSFVDARVTDHKSGYCVKRMCLHLPTERILDVIIFLVCMIWYVWYINQTYTVL